MWPFLSICDKGSKSFLECSSHQWLTKKMETNRKKYLWWHVFRFCSKASEKLFFIFLLVLSPVEWSTVVYSSENSLDINSFGHSDDKDTFDQRVAVCLQSLQRPWRLTKRDDGNLICCSLHTQWHLSKEFFFWYRTQSENSIMSELWMYVSTCFCDILGTSSLTGTKEQSKLVRVRAYTMKMKVMQYLNKDGCKTCVLICAKSQVSIRLAFPRPWRQHSCHFFPPSHPQAECLQQMTSGWWLWVSSANHVAPSKLQRVYSFSCDFSK